MQGQTKTARFACVALRSCRRISRKLGEGGDEEVRAVFGGRICPTVLSHTVGHHVEQGAPECAQYLGLLQLLPFLLFLSRVILGHL
jgi:hypothetical protein